MDMVASVRACKVKVLGLLTNYDRVNVLTVAAQLGERSMVVYQAVGWLVCEGKIRYEQIGNQVYLSIADGI